MGIKSYSIWEGFGLVWVVLGWLGAAWFIRNFQKTLKRLVLGLLWSYRDEKKSYNTNFEVLDPNFGVPELYDCNLGPTRTKN